MANQALTEAVYYILLSLTDPLHGYGIMQNVEKLSGGRVRLAAGTLYGALNTLLEKGWITALPGEKDTRKKEYQITPEGRLALMDEIARLTELLENGKKLFGGKSDAENGI
ncbi:MAG: helix-turn-helix transcriptional regulator [Clostridia bacterium]|nr:helix-turn-helix transcriptional regulator [Clostridia bacterium]